MAVDGLAVTQANGRLRPGWPHAHGNFSLAAGSAMPAGLWVLRYGVMAVTPRTVGRAEPRRSDALSPQVFVPSAASRAGIRPHRESRGPAGGRAGPPQEQTSTQLSAQHGRSVTRQRLIGSGGQASA